MLIPLKARITKHVRLASPLLLLLAPVGCDPGPEGGDDEALEERELIPIHWELETSCVTEYEDGTSAPAFGFKEKIAGRCFSRQLRLIAPASTSMVTSRRPRFRWQQGMLEIPLRLEICADRACSEVYQAYNVSGTWYRPATPLPPGTWFFRVRGRPGSGYEGTTSATWQFTVGEADTAVPTSWGTIADFNGDGLADVTVGDFGANGGDGRAFVFTGAPAGVGGGTMTIVAGDPGEQAKFGASPASVGDLNGDGYGDFAVGASEANSYGGAVYIYFGGPGGIGTEPDHVIFGADDPNPFDSTQVVEALGVSVSAAGDVNGDGYGDLVVGGPAWGASKQGRAHLFYGSPLGPLKDTTELSDAPIGSSVTLTGRGDIMANFGASVAAAGDVNGDGYADIVVGESFAGGWFDVGVMGRAYVYYGSSSGLNEAPVVLKGQAPADPEDDDGFGFAVAGAGDVNGDGYSDVLVGAYSSDGFTGKAYVFHGRPGAFDVTPDRVLAPSNGSAGFYAIEVAPMRDYDEDGYDDIVIGECDANNLDGRIHLYRGSASGILPTAKTINGPSVAGDGYFGEAVFGPGDINGDGHVDLLVGSPGKKQLHVFHGNGSTFSAGANTILTDGAIGAFFGTDVGH